MSDLHALPVPIRCPVIVPKALVRIWSLRIIDFGKRNGWVMAYAQIQSMMHKPFQDEVLKIVTTYRAHAKA